MDDLTIWQPGFDLLCYNWSLETTSRLTKATARPATKTGK